MNKYCKLLMLVMVFFSRFNLCSLLFFFAKCVIGWVPSEIDKHVFRVQIAGSMRKSAVEFYCSIKRCSSCKCKCKAILL